MTARTEPGRAAKYAELQHEHDRYQSIHPFPHSPQALLLPRRVPRSTPSKINTIAGGEAR